MGPRTRHEEQAHLRGDDVPSGYGSGEQERVPAKDADDPGLVAPGDSVGKAREALRDRRPLVADGVPPELVQPLLDERREHALHHRLGVHPLRAGHGHHLVRAEPLRGRGASGGRAHRASRWIFSRTCNKRLSVSWQRKCIH